MGLNIIRFLKPGINNFKCFFSSSRLTIIFKVFAVDVVVKPNNELKNHRFKIKIKNAEIDFC